jgi:hypothetical protein
MFFTKSNLNRILSFDGILSTNGAGAVTNALDTASAPTVARTAVGKITVTFPNFYEKVYSYNADLFLAAPNGSIAQIDSFTLNSSGKAVMVIGTYTAAFAATDTTGTVCWSAVVRK